MVARSRRRPQAPPSRRLILDSGAVIALARNDPRARAFLAAAREVGADVTIPAVVLAETVGGGATDAPVNRVVNAVGHVTAVDEHTARTAGEILRATRSSATVDAIVVATAAAVGGGVVLTGDPDDLRPLAARTAGVVVRQL